ncbi:uncharacterized protein [Amphiura filiformis]|uniref:uncharacterized protein n=1 Tax=Amphiura filiformis TaxID=82378 RepID=UPI003B21B7FC
MIAAITYVTFCVLSSSQLTAGLTSSEQGWFESEELPVIPDNPDLVGDILVGTNGDGSHTLISNGIPDHAVGTRNQYPILEQSFRAKLPGDPQNFPGILPQPLCLPAASLIGFATNGVAIYSPFDSSGNDISIHDGACQGRTMYGGIYYYAQLPDECSTFTPGFRQHDPSRIYGVAIDGFPIYGPGEGIDKITNAELDECHGKYVDGQYRYYMTDEWPYVLGCFRGTPKTVTGAQPSSGICRYLCSDGTLSATYPCNGVNPPTIPNMPTTRPPPLSSGWTIYEVSLFDSEGTYPIPGSNLYGEVSIGRNNDGTYTLRSNGIPDHGVGNIPSAENPNPIAQQSFTLRFPQNPSINAQPTCLPAQSIIGFTTNGVAIFSSFDNSLNNLNLDFGTNCQGRTSSRGIYYYAQTPDQCSTYIPGYRGHVSSEIYGVALDGFPIYGPGSGYTNAQLDACHGKEVNGRYGYYMNDEWPYILGCFRGTKQYVQGAPSPSQICKFACNRYSFSDTFTCINDFPVTPPIGPQQPIATTMPTQPPLSSGLNSYEASRFQSKDYYPISGSSLNGDVSVTTNNDGSNTYMLVSNGIPDHSVGNIPNADNPTMIRQQSFSLRFPQNPIMNPYASCLPAQSIIGFARNGVAIFSPFDNFLNNLNLEFGTDCQGRTSSGGIYYYAQTPDQCDTFRGQDTYGIYGVALDGFPIYGPGWNYPNTQLDACHGRYDSNGRYGYYMNDEWPYILGCFRGTPQYVQGAPTRSSVCRFACNKNSVSNTVTCRDDFDVIPPLVRPQQPVTTTIQPPLPTNSGLNSYEASLFESEGIFPIPGSNIFGEVSIGRNNDGTYTLRSNGIPDHGVGNIPNAENPNPIAQQSFSLRFPQNPSINAQPTCLPAQSIIGFTTNGVAIFSPFDNSLNNLNLDFGTNCQGRTSSVGIYYYAQTPDQCSTYTPGYRGHNSREIYGVALDGFPIYGPGSGYTNAQLDACHGKEVNGRYGYYMNDEWPYILGCFRGTKQYVQEAPSPSQICKFACNRYSFSDTFTCINDFPVPPPIGSQQPITTTMPIPPPLSSGLNSYEASRFQSETYYPISGSSLNGDVSVITNNDGSNTYMLVSNGIPDHSVGNIPNADNPTMIRQQSFSFRFPQNPIMNPYTSCLPAQSIIGFARNGVAIFSPFDNFLNNLNLEFGTNCQGRTSSGGVYYYAQTPDQCDTFRGQDTYGIYGVALDGFPIYGPGWNYPNTQLDACHGRFDFNGRYGYYMNNEWPYILGCFRGTPQDVQGAPSRSSVCRFACNKNSDTNAVTCRDDFDVVPPPQPPITTTMRSETKPPSTSDGLSETDIKLFKSDTTKVIPGLAPGSVTIYAGFGGDSYLLISNGIPDHNVDTSQINDISEQAYQMSFPRYPVINTEPKCVPANSIIGFAINGVPIFSHFDDNLADQTKDFGDKCQGLVDPEGRYYYSQLPDKCGTFDPDFGGRGRDPNSIYGVALDGFPIYGPGEGETKISNADLDACHGKFVNGQYRYYMTEDFPYVIGCFRGDPQIPVSEVCEFVCDGQIIIDATGDVIPCKKSTRPNEEPTEPRGVTDSEISEFSSRQIFEPITEEIGIVEILQDDDSIIFVSNGIPDHATGQWAGLSVQEYVVTFLRSRNIA